MDIKEKLYKWRDSEATRKGIEAFRILPNQTLDEIAEKIPTDKDTLCMVKGIKEMKFAQYGKTILSILDNTYVETEQNTSENNETEKIFTVNEYLNYTNSKLNQLFGKVRGEITSFQASGNAVYFTIKDKDEDAILSVFMWSSDYKISGVTAEIGVEVIINGKPEIYKPNGRLSFRANTIEYFGEGALRKAYNELKLKLEKENLFSIERKKIFKKYPKKIGLITSKQGAVIHDFLNNLNKNGFDITFIDSRVEGSLAITELIYSLKTLKKKDLDVIVIIRGGGSLESLQAFNNEAVVREIVESMIPIICAIGHDKDVPLSQLVADYSPSTPSMCTEILNKDFRDARYEIKTLDSNIKNILSNIQVSLKNSINRQASLLTNIFYNFQGDIKKPIIDYYSIFKGIKVKIANELNILNSLKQNLSNQLNHDKIVIEKSIENLKLILDAHNPLNRLKIGYSITYNDRMIVRSVGDLKINDKLTTEIKDGNIITTVNEIIKYEQETD